MIYLQNASLIFTGYNLTDWLSLLFFHMIINGNNGCSWSKVPCTGGASRFMQEWAPFIGGNYNAKRRKQMNTICMLYIAIVKRTAVCTENQGSWSQADQLHVLSSFLQWSGNIESTITEARCYSSNLPQAN